MGSTRTGDGKRREPFDGVVLDGDGKRIGLGALTSTDDPVWLELPRFVGDVGTLVWRVLKDRRISTWQKVAAGAAVAYVVSPLDVIPDVLPGLGQLDDLFVIRQALKLLADAAGTEVLREHWTGSEEGFALVLRVAGLPGARPDG